MRMSSSYSGLSSLKRWLAAAAVVLGVPMLQGRLAAQSWYSTGGTWTSRKPITVDHTKVSGSSSLSNFPMLFSVTDPNLKTLANGGSVGTSNGYDILFTASDGVTKLNHEIEQYNGSTGKVAAWVNIPTLSSTADTVLYIYYGNTSASNQQNVSGVWDSNYKSVYHLPDGTTLAATDSAVSGVNGTNNGATATSGQIGGAAGFNGTGQYIDVARTVNYSQLTVQGWFYAPAAFSDKQDIIENAADPLTNNLGFRFNFENWYGGAFRIGNGSGAQAVSFVDLTGTKLAAGVWHQFAGTYDGSTMTVYLDGASFASNTFTGSIAPSGFNINIGRNLTVNSWNWNGTLDEIRISSTARSAGWITTEYNNQVSPSTFFTVGSQTSGPVAAPAFSPAGGTYSSAQTVTISTSTSGASIRYTTDGSTPTSSVGTLYATPVSVSSTVTIKAVAFATGMTDSPVSSASYTINPPVAAPAFGPAAGTYSAAQTVTISTSTSGASIRYTTDGSTPTSSVGTLYSTPVSVSSTVTIKAVAFATGMTDSPVSSASYTINAPVAAPLFNPAAGTYSAAQTVTISTSTSGASIRYTTDGSTPTSSVGTLYSSAITVSVTTTIKAIAYASGMTDSPVVSAAYTISSGGPGWYNTGGTWTNRKQITIDHTKVSGSSSLSNFPMLFSVTDPDLKTLANGGIVGTSNGYDILFTASDGVTKLNHEIEQYNGSTGKVAAWVNIPTLSATADTVLYIYYGNTSTSNQQNVSGVWDSNYKSVYHLPDGTTLAATDSAGSGVNGTNNGATAASGQIGGAAGFNGSNQYIDVARTVNYSQLTVEGWFYAPSSFSNKQDIVGNDRDPITNNLGFRFEFEAWYTGYFAIGNGGGWGYVYWVDGARLTAGVWHHFAGTYDGSTMKVYFDGAIEGSTSLSGSIALSGSNINIGRNIFGDNYWNGTLDEIRISSVARSADWITTEYNNQLSPSTFLALGSQTVAAPAFSPAGGTYSAAQNVTISTSTSGASIRYTTDGSTPTSSVGTLYTSAITVNSTVTIRAIAYKSGMTDSSVVSASYTISSGGPGWYSTGGTWTNRKPITVDHTKVSGSSNLSSFPMLFSVTDPNLKTLANGGSVGTSNGYDILFTASDGVTKLNHEIEQYNGSTGKVVAWVNIPTLSATADTVLYIYYGNTSASDQQNVSGVWDSNYKSVYHLPDGTTLAATDSAASGVNGTNNGATATSGQVGGAAGFNGSNQYIDVARTVNYSQLTVEGWFYAPSSFSNKQDIVGNDRDPITNNLGFRFEFEAWYTGYFAIGNGGGWGYVYWVDGARLTAGVWHHFAGTYDGSTMKVYFDGAIEGSSSFSGSIALSGSNINIGRNIFGDNYWNGTLDEIRISSVARSAGWITTEYNNQLSPPTFYSVGVQQGGGSSVLVTVTTAPAGLSVTVDGSACTAPCGVQWTPGTTHTIATTGTQGGATGVQYVFANWSDSGALSHSVTAPSSSTAYTANFATQYALTTTATAGGSITPASAWYGSGAVVAVSATANGGYGFSGFSGALSGTTTPQNLTMNGPATVTANFAPAPVTISVTPGTSTLSAGQTQQFTATVTGSTNTTVTWSLAAGAPGSISTAGLYTAPGSIPSQQTVTVTATSQADTTKTAVATITLTPPVTISVAPGTSTLTAGQTQQFTATVTGSTNTAVTWSISPAATGSISAAGLYTAPASVTSQQMMTVTATSQADTAKTANATITLNPPVTISVAPGTITLSAGQTHQFTATVAGSTNTAVTWSLAAGAPGSISATGLYTAPISVTQEQTATLIATSQADSTKTASGAVTLNPVAISVAPVSVTLTGGQTQQFTASVSGTANMAVNWTMTPAGTGSITNAGLYTAPTTVSSLQTVTITATSAAYPAKSASVAVSLNPPPTTGLTIVPSVLNLVVGETHTIQALDTAGKPVTGLTWTSTGPSVVSQSTDDPPLLTALTAGHVTIAAGGASADVTVYVDPLPVGTVVWSNPAIGSAGGIVPAVPSPSGVADVFAAEHVVPETESGNVSLAGLVQAITSDGATAWSAKVTDSALPDFQGGLIELLWDGSYRRGLSGHTGIVRIDGITGQRYPVYTPDFSADPSTGFGLGNSLTLGVHPDGTVFTTEFHLSPGCEPGPCTAGFLVGIDPTTGTQKFNVPMAARNQRWGNLIIAGDGYAYLPYWYQPGSTTTFLNLLRVSSNGDYNDISISQSPHWYADDPAMITNADNGILITWLEGINGEQAHMAIVSGTGVQLVSAPVIGAAGQYSAFTAPVIQTQDGSFVGTGWDGNGNLYTIAFGQNGNIRWSVPNKVPKIATADGSIIATDPLGSAAVRFDQNGAAVEQIGNLPTQSWAGLSYILSGGSLSQVVQPPILWASTFQTVAGGSPSGNSTSVPFLVWREGLALWASGRGPKCQVGSEKVPLAGNALDQYIDLKQGLLAGGYLTGSACSAFFNANQTRAGYFSQLSTAVSHQIPYDGSQSTISMYDAGLWTAKDAATNPLYPKQWKKTPVCANFQNANSSLHVAEAQAQPPATDVYINSKSKVLKKYLAQSTLLHEALHNLTGLGDDDVEILLGLTATASKGKATDVINTTLATNGCAAK